MLTNDVVSFEQPGPDHLTDITLMTVLKPMPCNK